MIELIQAWVSVPPPRGAAAAAAPNSVASDQQQGQADHALRQPGAGVRERQPAQHGFGEQPSVRGCAHR
jgi:hypothetical protein